MNNSYRDRPWPCLFKPSTTAHNAENCGWGAPGRDYCSRKKRPLFAGECHDCRYWVKRSRLDRLRGRVGR